MLYIIFSFDSQLATTRSIIITFTAVIWLSVRIHKEFYINAIEASVYLNLIILAVFETNSPVLVHPLVSVVFVTMVGIIMYHFHLLYIAKSELWQRTTTRIRFFVETYRGGVSGGVSGGVCGGVSGGVKGGVRGVLVVELRVEFVVELGVC